jgi:hypothetical protein
MRRTPEDDEPHAGGKCARTAAAVKPSAMVCVKLQREVASAASAATGRREAGLMPGAPPRGGGGGGGGGAEGDPGVYGTRRLLEVAPPTRPAPPPPGLRRSPPPDPHPSLIRLRRSSGKEEKGTGLPGNGQERGETEKFTRGYAVSLKP